jgi:Na+-transporting NADH:ubiquinone oxidoreductase subunit NqrC
MEIILYILITLVIAVLYACYNLFLKTEQLEKIVDQQNQYITNISELIELSNKKIGESEVAQAFKADDDIGFFFETLQEIQTQLNSFKTRNN